MNQHLSTTNQTAESTSRDADGSQSESSPAAQRINTHQNTAASSQEKDKNTSHTTYTDEIVAAPERSAYAHDNSSELTATTTSTLEDKHSTAAAAASGNEGRSKGKRSFAKLGRFIKLAKWSSNKDTGKEE